MRKKYNIALVPCQREAFVSLAKPYRSRSDGYCIGENSIPHVTLHHFYEDPRKIKKLWRELSPLCEEAVVLTFAKTSIVTFDHKIYWFSLLPAEQNTLHVLHNEVAKKLNLTLKKPFDPHLTLFNTLQARDKISFDSLVPTYSDVFYLALGPCDPVGQLKQIYFNNKN